MVKLLDWFNRNPSALASVASAVIAASAALVVFALTQFLTQRRERTRFLTPKLEELYLLLNSIAEDNVKFFRLVYLSLEGDARARKELGAIDDVALYGHGAAKRVIMYIRLYFPRLSRIH